MANVNIPRPTDASIILTYRCPMRCEMCNIWKNPTNKSEEIKAEDLKSLPQLKFINLTGESRLSVRIWPTSLRNATSTLHALSFPLPAGLKIA